MLHILVTRGNGSSRDKKATITVNTYWNHWGGCGSDSYKILSYVLFSVLCKDQSQKASRGPMERRQGQEQMSIHDAKENIILQLCALPVMAPQPKDAAAAFITGRNINQQMN